MPIDGMYPIVAPVNFYNYNKHPKEYMENVAKLYDTPPVILFVWRWPVDIPSLACDYFG